MANEKNVDVGEELGADEEDFAADSSARARNRTVMLTPEITGQVRAMLAEEMGEEGSVPTGGFGLGGNAMSGGGFVQPTPQGVPAPQPQGIPEPQPMQGFPPPPAQPVIPQPAVMHPPQVAPPVQVHNSPVVGFLVSFDTNENGDVFELRSGRWIISSEHTTAGNFIIVADKSISPLHAIIRVTSAGEIQVLDQLSEHGTGILKFGTDEEEELTGSMSSLEHGDLVRFGERYFHVCVIQKREE